MPYSLLRVRLKNKSACEKIVERIQNLCKTTPEIGVESIETQTQQFDIVVVLKYLERKITSPLAQEIRSWEEVELVDTVSSQQPNASIAK